MLFIESEYEKQKYWKIAVWLKQVEKPSEGLKKLAYENINNIKISCYK